MSKKKQKEGAAAKEVGKQLEDFDMALTLVQMASALVRQDAVFDAYMNLEREIIDARSAFVRERIRMVRV